MLSSLGPPVPTEYPRITSRQHPAVREARALAHRTRDDTGVLIDGAHVLAGAIRARVLIRTVLVSTSFLSRASAADAGVVPLAARAGATVFEVSDTVLDAASPVRTPSGIVAIADWTTAPLTSTFAPAPAFTLGLVDVQDPGNAGAVIRSAHAFGATGVIAIGESADPAGWKAIRAAMGSTFVVPVASASLEDALAEARHHGVRVVATIAHGAMPLDEIDLRLPTLILLGREGAGLPAGVVDQADARMTVPMRDGVESLNVAVTAGIIAYEAQRRRTQAV